MACLSGIPKKKKPLICRKEADSGIYYHYTSLDTLWAVLDSETLRATQACFSNDSEEVEKGKKLVADVCREICDKNLCEDSQRFCDYADQLTQDEEGVDCYIVCFCKNGDKLSQWRAYCRNDGVSIGLAFDGTQRNYYFADMPDGNQPGRNATIYPVWYLHDGSLTVEGQNIVTQENVTQEIIDYVVRISKLADFQKAKASLELTIPLIKNAGFYEEEEYRLLICNSLSAQGGVRPFPLDTYVMTRQDNGLQNPYINISFGTKYSEKSKTDLEKNKTIEQQWAVKTIHLYNVSKQLNELIRKRFVGITICEDGVEGERHPQIVIGSGHDQRQQEVFEKVECAVREVCTDEEREKTKIWCEGHLPIRIIRVSPCSNQEQVIKAIKHYCKHKKYWLKYVDVEGSSIPYRRPR